MTDMKTKPLFVVPITLTYAIVFLTAGVRGLGAADKFDTPKIERLAPTR